MGCCGRVPALALGLAIVGTAASGATDARAQAAPPATGAQAVPNANEARAEARFRDGSDAFDHGRVDEACTAFAESLRLFPTLGSLLNLALCHEKQGKTASAWSEFVHAAASVTDPAQHDRRDFARQHAARLEKALPRLQIDVASGTSPVSVSIAVDGDVLSDAQRALPLFVDPGEHSVHASAPGYKTFRTTVAVAAPAPTASPSSAPGEAATVHVPLLEPEPQAAVTSPPPSPAPEPAWTLREKVGLGVGGAGIVALGVGIGFGADAVSRIGGLARCAASCDAGPAKTSEIVSLVTLSAGALALAGGAWLVFAPGRSAGASQAPVASLYVAPAFDARTGPGVAVGGAW